MDMRKRVSADRKRWMKLYKYDFLDLANYSLVIDTTRLSPEQVVESIMEFVNDF
jgi:cytidylate kinase